SRLHAGPPAPAHWSSGRVTPPACHARGQTSARTFPVHLCALRMPTSFPTLVDQPDERRETRDRSCIFGHTRLAPNFTASRTRNIIREAAKKGFESFMWRDFECGGIRPLP